MKKQLLTALCVLATYLPMWGQGMTDAQILKYVQQEAKAGASESDIAARLMQKGVSMDQIQRIRQQYSRQISKRGLDSAADNAISSGTERMRTNNELEEADNQLIDASRADVSDIPHAQSPQSQGARRVFGRDVFNNHQLTFEPQMNIATPQDYVLGPGDQLVVDVFGATQESMTLTISPDGDIVVPDYGPIPVSGLTVAAAQSRIGSRLGGYFSSSSIKTSLGQTRTIQVNVMGEVATPGTYTLSAFATVFHALYRAGGINELGTLRNIKVVRQGRVISVIDIYEFILNGRLAGNVRLADNDVIQVGPYDCIVDVEGRVKRPMAYEMRKDESLATLLRYSGGFASDAYKKSVRLFRKSGRMKEVYNVEEFDFSSFKVDDGDVVSVDSLLDRYECMVEVKGAVFRPGMYRLGETVHSVKSLIEKADGLTEEALVSRAVMRRMKPNRTQEVVAVDVAGILAGTTPDMALQNEDVLFVPTIAEHQNLRTLTIEGEVIFPGTYEYAEGITVGDLVLQAGGLTDAASTVKVDVSRRLRDPEATTAGMEISKTFSVALDDSFSTEGGQGFLLEPYDIVQVRRSPVFRTPLRVTVEGEIAFRGSYSMEVKNQRLSDLVKAAGGTVDGAYLRGARLMRQMTADERARMQTIIRMARQGQDANDSISLDKLDMSTTYSVGIHLDEALAHPGCDDDIELVEGDRLIIPRISKTVRINGDVLSPNTVAYKSGRSYKYYVEQAGGYGNRAKKTKAFIVYQNGTIAKANKGKVEPGCEIIIPSKEKRNGLSVAQWLGIGTSIASLGTMFATIANLTK